MFTPQTCRTLLGAALGGAGLALMLACTSAVRAPRDVWAAGPPDPAADSVMVGYGAQVRRRVTGSVGTVVAGADDRTRYVGVADMIRGRVPGVVVQDAPGGEFSVRIRGINTLIGHDEPLFVIDGVPSSASMLAGMSPNDVARIDVLRDGASAAIYGSRGANGVVLVTTKRPPRPRR